MSEVFIKQIQKVSSEMTGNLYVFFREEGFYTIRLKDDLEAIHNAKLNDGTLKVEDENNKVVWFKATGGQGE